jgi:hypothetical protein
MTMPAAGPESARRYDLYLRAGGVGPFVRLSDQGLTLDDDGIRWAIAGRDAFAPWATIAAVHLSTGGDAELPVAMCQIRLAGGETFAVYNSNAAGTANTEQVPIYHAFIRDFHTRLASQPNRSTQFSSGYSDVRHHIAFIATIALTLVAIVAPLALVWIMGEWHILYVVVAGAFLVVPMIRRVIANAPRTYDPLRLPQELIG